MPLPSPARALLFVLFAPTVGQPSNEDAWFFEDFEEQAAQVNEGSLRFLESPPDTPAHHHHNRIRLLGTSLVDGWAILEQCHQHLDAVPRAEIVFRSESIRALEITRHKNIAQARVEDASDHLISKRAPQVPPHRPRLTN